MNFRELEYQSRRRDHLALERLNRRLEQADQHWSIREEVLTELGFLPKHGKLPWARRWNRWSRRLEYIILVMPAVPILIAYSVLDGALWMFGNFLHPLLKELTLRHIIFPLLAAIAAYQNWRRSRLNSTVDDSLKRKDMVNALIMNNPELLLPYVQTALHAAVNTREFESDQFLDAKVDMYIYGEIDNFRAPDMVQFPMQQKEP
jgi:hypothetical protein